MNKKLPPRPNLEQLRKQAKAIQKGHQASNAKVLSEILQHHPQWNGKSQAELAKAKFPLSDAQWVIARQYGFKNWRELKAHVESRQNGETNEAAVKALRDAAGNGDLHRVKGLLAVDPGLVNEVSSPGMRTALHDAATRGRDDIVEFLLENGADPNIRCEGDSAMPLHFAAENQHLSTIRLLIEHGADPIGEGDYHELEVIGWATSFDYLKVNPEVVEYLLSHGAPQYFAGTFDGSNGSDPRPRFAITRELRATDGSDQQTPSAAASGRGEEAEAFARNFVGTGSEHRIAR